MSEIDLSRNLDTFNKAQLHSRRATSRKSGGIGHEIRSSVFATFRYAIDATIAAVGLLVLAPMILMLVAVLLVLQGRPIFIAHRRIGRNGVMFPCLKFRTMVRNADDVLNRHLAANPPLRAEWNATRKLKDDPRVTPFGALLRKEQYRRDPSALQRHSRAK